MTDMPRPRLPHLHKETTRHGSTVWYVRIGKGPRARLRSQFGSEAFRQEYEAALSGEKPTKPRGPLQGSLEWLWNAYQLSAAWADFSPATRRQRENIMRRVLETNKETAFADIKESDIQAGIDRRASTPFAARNFLETIRGLFEWAKKSGHVKVNPCAELRAKRGKTKGFVPWTIDDMLKFEARWPLGTRQRLIYAIYAYTGLRRSDAVRFGRQHIRDGIASIPTEKTGDEAVFEILPELQEAINAGPCGDLTFIVGADGFPLVKESLGTLFKEACVAAGVNEPGKAAHGLRKAAAARAAENGATLDQLKGIFGWSDNQTPALYTGSARKRHLARGSSKLLSRANS